VAKRSVRKARARAAHTPVTDASPRSKAPSRSFWLGALVAAAVLVPPAVVAILVVGSGDSAAAPATADATQSEIEVLRRQDAVRNKQQIEDLTARARSMVDDFTPVIAGLGRTLPADSERVGPLASAATVEDWRARVRAANAYFAETVSGETATNVARNGLGDAVAVLAEAVETYKLALDSPAMRPALLKRVRSQRDLATHAWFTAAIQLDVINIDAGFGHQHVVFPTAAGSAAVPPDDLPDGTGATSPDGG
jgi:hypothetical protein